MENIDNVTTTTENTTVETSDANLSATDKAIQAARARKAAKANGTVPTAPASTPRVKLTDADRKAKLEQILVDRAARKEARQTSRAKVLADRAANAQPAHLSKVQKAAEKLGVMSADAQSVFDEATAGLPAADIACLAAHLAHFNRVNATVRATQVELEVGQNVRVIGGDPRFIGQVGTLARVNRIRVYVTIAGQDRPHYCFSSDVEVIEAESVEETPVESEAQAS